MVELESVVLSETLLKIHLITCNTLIKDLTSKIDGNYLRLAIRNFKENDVLLKALWRELGLLEFEL